MRKTSGTVLVVSGVLAFVVVALTTSLATAYDRYNDGCQICHGEFTGPTSPQGTQFPGDDKHRMHRSAQDMNTECDLCHSSNDGNDPFIGMSDGTNDNPGLGCTGCHDAVGLRAHHFVNNTTICAGCHPNDPPPAGEDVVPVYYGTVDTNVDDPCNSAPAFLENWSIGDTVGQDNDGDNDYDQDDSDCAACPADLDGDGFVNAADLAGLLGSWGPNPGSPADLDGNGIVNAADLASLLGSWGAC